MLNCDRLNKIKEDHRSQVLAAIACFAGTSEIKAADDDKHSHADQFSAVDKTKECLRSHHGGVARLDHAVKAIKLRLADGLRAASSKKMPSVT